MSNYQQLRLSSLPHLHENVFLIVFVLAFKHEKAFVTKRLAEALKHIDDMNLSILYVTMNTQRSVCQCVLHIKGQFDTVKI